MNSFVLRRSFIQSSDFSDLCVKKTQKSLLVISLILFDKIFIYIIYSTHYV